MSKTIVTHMFPDLDAIASCWLLKKFDSEFNQAEVKFVPAGMTFENKTVDSDPNIVHVDTGLGRFDHHQLDSRVCAAGLVFNYLKCNKKVALKYQSALERLVEIITQIDHFEDFFWQDSNNDRYDFCLHHIFDHLKLSGQLKDEEMVVEGEKLLDAILFGLKQKIVTEKELEKGIKFESKWGQSLGIETKVSRVSKLAQKKGFGLVVRKEPKTNLVSVKSQPKKDLDLTELYLVLKEKDKNADWFFHQSKHIILNGSRHNPKVRPSILSLEELIEIVKNIRGGVRQ
ncbi:MAG: hypothetical protein U9Q63_01140 [Patescibacteria group bacterium]|nr:hypothetical protein [Patescibacteria group bacterium]